MTDAAGMAQADVYPNATVTAIRNRGMSYALVTVTALNPGDAITLVTAPSTVTTHVQRYSADCNDDGEALWDFFYYDAVTPADSRIEFEIRTAPTEAELDANTIPFVPIAEAHAVPTETQRCEVGPPNCPIDIFSELGAPSQQYKELELRVRMIPGSSGEGPLLRDWRLRYSCPPAQ